MLELGLAMSHSPVMFTPVERWPEVHRRITPNVPPPQAIEAETEEVRASYMARIQGAFAELRGVLEEVQPDLLVIIGDDQDEVFGPSIIPNLAVFVGDETHGTLNMSVLGQPLNENHITLKSHTEFATHLLEELTARGFNPAAMRELEAVARPEVGLGHAFTRPANVLHLPDLGIPVVVVFINAYHPPLPTGQRFFELGEAIREIADARPERVAVLASGGLAHDPLGPRSGWLDKKLDNWILEQIATGQGRRLTNLFSFESEMFDGGTGEVRSWITVAGAFEGTPATIVDYVPAIHSVTGLGFAYWRR